ncbi:hypothetical protein D3C72_1769140 [compost metagenome]
MLLPEIERPDAGLVLADARIMRDQSLHPGLDRMRQVGRTAIRAGNDHVVDGDRLVVDVEQRIHRHDVADRTLVDGLHRLEPDGRRIRIRSHGLGECDALMGEQRYGECGRTAQEHASVHWCFPLMCHFWMANMRAIR